MLDGKSEASFKFRASPFFVIAHTQESFDRKKLEELLKLTYPPEQVLSYPDVFYVSTVLQQGST